MIFPSSFNINCLSMGVRKYSADYLGCSENFCEHNFCIKIVHNVIMHKLGGCTHTCTMCKNGKRLVDNFLHTSESYFLCFRVIFQRPTKHPKQRAQSLQVQGLPFRKMQRWSLLCKWQRVYTLSVKRKLITSSERHSLLKIHAIKINNIWTQILSFNTP